MPAGAKICVVARAGSRGAEVVRVVEIDTGNGVERTPRRPAVDPSAAFDLTGKVKWFDDARGFDFVASDDFGRDVFVHSTTLAPRASEASSRARRCQCASSRRRRAARRLRSSSARTRKRRERERRSAQFVLAAQSAREDAHHAQREKWGVLDQEEKLIFLDRR